MKKMKNQIINIPAIDDIILDKREKVFGLIEHICEAKKLLKNNIDCNISKLLNDCLNNCYKTEENIDNAIYHRFETWTQLLHKFYKMTERKSFQTGEYKSITYIYPYNVILSNETLWVLEVNPNDSYNGGVRDKSYSLDTKLNSDITLEEITEEEFKKQITISTTNLINRRIKKEENEN